MFTTLLAARFEERKAFAIAAIERLTFADDTDEVTLDLVAVVRAVAGLMPTERADQQVEEVADILAGEMADDAEWARENASQNADGAEADYRYELARDMGVAA